MQIFLSYASEQKPDAETIAFALRKRGHRVFLDKDDLPPGRSYDDQIQSAVFAADLMIFLISPESVTPGRYTLTELEYARHRWRQPDRTVLPVMLRPTPMARVPAFLKAVTIHEPSGNLAAEVAFWVDQLRGRDYVLRMVGWFALGGLISGLAYLGTKEGWFGFPDIPYALIVGTLIDNAAKTVGLSFGSSTSQFQIALSVVAVGMLFPAGIVMAALARLMVKVAWLRSSLAGCIVAIMTGAGVLAGALSYNLMEAPYREIRRLADELMAARQELATYRAQGQAPASGVPPAEPAEEPQQHRDTALVRAMDLEWGMIRLRVGLIYGLVFGAGMMLAGTVISSAVRSSRRWFISLAGSLATAGTLYFATNSLTVSFLLYHVGIFALLGYWVARGQE